ncbi:hypothetical protein [Poritiphilus flavus]|uniref:Uncharacterized protein n=1 Tax=Poritiphilus flavus TaxID=2697053 RepID=A0A6L9EIN7_9FLAO|nr:hypothetical protein [Poritiphilus flavus]NAS14049.1 hypothetical protein [Poritiphilus flavus]
MEEGLKNAVKEVHLAAQYLATAAKSFTVSKEDDSHTNLGFNTVEGSLETWPLDDQGLKLKFEYKAFSLSLGSDDKDLMSFALDGQSHEMVVDWLGKAATGLGMAESYDYDLHYSLPYEGLTADFKHEKPSERHLGELLRLRNIAHTAMENLVAEHMLETNIRIWPHHFDSGGYVVIPEGVVSGIGFGMAVPDTLIDDFYLYCSGYHGHQGLDTSSFKPLSMGKWLNEGFKGATLPLSAVGAEMARSFFEETINAYISL